MKKNLAVFGALLLSVVIAHHLHAPAAGFVLDDWIFAEKVHNLGIIGSAREFLTNGHARRPLQVIVLPLTYKAALAWPPAGQIILAVLGGLEAFIFFILLRDMTGRARFAFLAAMLAAVAPIRPATHLWLSNASQLIAHCLVLGSLISHRRGRVLSSQWAYAGGFMLYESAAFLPILVPCVAAIESEGLLIPKYRALYIIRQSLPYAVTFAVCIAWIYLGAPLLNSTPNRPEISVGHFFKVFADGAYWSTMGAFR